MKSLFIMKVFQYFINLNSSLELLNNALDCLLDQILNLADGSRVRRETSPTMTNTIELYVVIDYYLYIR